MSDIRLICGDCLEVMPMLPAASIDLILADLPYGTTACSWDVVIPFEPLWREYRRLIKPRGAVVLFGQQPFTALLIASNLEWFKYCWVWEKSRAFDFFNNKNKPRAIHEDIAVFTDGTTANHSDRRMTYNPQGLKRVNRRWSRPQKYDSEHNTNRPSHSLDRVIEFSNYPESIIRFSNPNNDAEHPTQKPVALLEYLIRTYTNPGDTVLDNTMGSGSTGVACVNTGRHFIGMELRADYYAIAERRVAEAQMQPRLMLEAA